MLLVPKQLSNVNNISSTSVSFKTKCDKIISPALTNLFMKCLPRTPTLFNSKLKNKKAKEAQNYGKRKKKRSKNQFMKYSVKIIS